MNTGLPEFNENWPEELKRKWIIADRLGKDASKVMEQYTALQGPLHAARLRFFEGCEGVDDSVRYATVPKPRIVKYSRVAGPMVVQEGDADSNETWEFHEPVPREVNEDAPTLYIV